MFLPKSVHPLSSCTVVSQHSQTETEFPEKQVKKLKTTRGKMLVSMPKVNMYHFM